jgi:hypothetical protein
MGATVVGYWRGITDEQLDSQPGFWDDCQAFANWMAERESGAGVCTEPSHALLSR